MEITLNVNIPSLDRFCDLLVKELGKQGVSFKDAAITGGATAPDTDSSADKADLKDIPAHLQGETTVEPKKGTRRGKTEAPAPVVAAGQSEATATPKETAPAAMTILTRDVVKAKLTDYSADKRYGMEGVMKKLSEYGVQRISDLPEAKFDVFYKDLEDSLAAPAKGPLD